MQGKGGGGVTVLLVLPLVKGRRKAEVRTGTVSPEHHYSSDTLNLYLD